MAKRNAEIVHLSGFPAGRAFGGYIYNVSINEGGSRQPTSFEISVMNETGEYEIYPENLSTIFPYTLIIGNNANISECLYYDSIFLTEYNWTDTTSGRILNLKFVDGSIILDKTHVLLFNDQATPYNFNGPFKNADSWRLKTHLVYIPVECNNYCESTQAPPFGEGARNPWPPSHPKSLGQPFGYKRVDPNGNPTQVKWYYNSLSANTNNVFGRAGGAIIIGEEQFKSNECEIAKIDYSFSELLAIISDSAVGIGVPVFDMSDRGYGLLGSPAIQAIRRNFSGGTLRSVLNQWCDLLGFSWYYDNTNGSIGAYDLKGVTNNFLIGDIRKKVDGIKENNTVNNPVAITDIKSSVSLDGTYAQDNITVYKKAPKASSRNRKIDKRVLFEPLTLSHIFPSNVFARITGGRTENELIQSAILAKYNPTARTLYNYYLIAERTNNFTNMSALSQYGKPLGISLRAKLTDQQKFDLLTLTFSTQSQQKEQAKYGKDSGVFLGTYSKDLENKWMDWERQVADFIGQYYFFQKPFADRFDCVEGLSNVIQEWTTKPNTETFQRNNLNELPFKDLIKHPEGAVGLSSVLTKNEFFLYRRTGTSYGFKDEELDSLFFEDGEELLKDFLPSHSPLEGSAKLFLDSMLRDVFPNIYPELEQLQDENKRPSLIFFPDIKTVTSRLEIGVMHGISGHTWVKNGGNPFMRGLNPNYPTFEHNKINKYEVLTKQEETDADKECKMLCDYDLIDELCECPAGDVYSPDNVGLSNSSARWFRLRVKQGEGWSPAFSFILPSEYPYSAYVSVSTESTHQQNGIIRHVGGVGNAGNTMEYRIRVNDISSDFDQTQGNKDRSLQAVAAGSESGEVSPKIIINGIFSPVSIYDFHAVAQELNYSNFMPKETLSFTMVGLNISALSPYTDVRHGFQGASVSVGDSGTRITFNYSNKPPTVTKEELAIQSIGIQRVF